MNTKSIIVVALTVLAGVACWTVLAQDENMATAEKAVKEAVNAPAADGMDPEMMKGMQNCPMCKAMMSDDPNVHVAMMKKMGMSDMEILHMQGLHNAPIYWNAPDVLLGMGDKISLTEEQKTKLEEIAKTARDEADKLLTEDQKKMIGPTDKPVTMMEMMKANRERMMKKSEAAEPMKDQIKSEIKDKIKSKVEEQMK